MIKKIVKFLISELLFTWKARAAAKDKVYRILLYHSIAARPKGETTNTRVNPEEFSEQMEFLARHGYNVIALPEVVERIKRKAPVIPKTIAITFDDGYKDFLKNAFPVLEKLNFPSTIFVCPAAIDKKIKRESARLNSEILEWDDLRWLRERGVSIGSHGNSHKDLAKIGNSELSEELLFSKARLEEKLNVRIETLSYPFGSFNRQCTDALPVLGYECALTTIPGHVSNNANLFSLNRTEIMLDNSNLREFQKKIYGCYDWLSIKRIFG